MSELYLGYIKNNYDASLYLVADFYKKFKDIIKESYITLNKNNLVERIGKDNYQELVDMVDKYYESDFSSAIKNLLKTIDVRKAIEDKMQKRVESVEELTKEDLKEFYNQLEQEGKKVRILNELPENTEEDKKNFKF